MTSVHIRHLFTVAVFALIVSELTDHAHSNSDAYSDIFKLTRLTIDNPSINRDLRPLLNQSQVMKVDVGFDLVSLVSVDDITQSCSINGYLMLTWMDELLRWNASDYGGFTELRADPDKLWHPVLTLINVVGEREVIDSKANPLIIDHTGNVTWVSGAIFSVACQLNIRRFPFDEQKCELFFWPMDYFSDKLVFVVSVSELDMTLFYPNKAWDLKRAYMSVSTTSGSHGSFSCPRITLHLKRRPDGFLFNVLAPVLMLSFLNLLVFTIPAESGEKISYGITVLLTLSIFLSQIYSTLPRDANEVSTLMVYLFFLTLNSVMSVLASIATVYFHHSKESKCEVNEDANYNCNSYLPKVTANVNRVSPKASEIDSNETKPIASSKFDDVTTKAQTHHRHWICTHINRISLTFFLTSWIVLMLWLFVDITM